MNFIAYVEPKSIPTIAWKMRGVKWMHIVYNSYAVCDNIMLYGILFEGRPW